MPGLGPHGLASQWRLYRQGWGRDHAHELWLWWRYLDLDDLAVLVHRLAIVHGYLQGAETVPFGYVSGAGHREAPTTGAHERCEGEYLLGKGPSTASWSSVPARGTVEKEETAGRDRSP